MANNEMPLRSLKVLEAGLENAFRSGDLGGAALLAWEILAVFPDQGFSARIYVKKLLRDPYIAGIDLETFRGNVAELVKTGDADELARLAALGILKFPGDRNLSLAMVHAAEQLKRPEWIEPALAPLGDPDESDHVHINALGTVQWLKGNIENAHRFFAQAHGIKPENLTYGKNYSLTLDAMGDPEAAIRLLESSITDAKRPTDHLVQLIPIYRRAGRDVAATLLELRDRHFSKCQTFTEARTYADASLLAGDISAAEFGSRQLLSVTHDPGVAFELAEIEIAQGKYDVGLDRYEERFAAIPNLGYKNLSDAIPRFTGEDLGGKTLLLLAEQGIGDEILFSMLFQRVDQLAGTVKALVDPRLIPIYSEVFPNWTLTTRFSHPPADCDSVCYMGHLLKLFLREQLAAGAPPRNIIREYQYRRTDDLPGARGETKERPMIGISWRGGATSLDATMRSMSLKRMVDGLGEKSGALLVSLQYDGQHAEEVAALQDAAVVNSGIDNRGDLRSVLALVRDMDAVVTVDNSVAHFAAAMGVPTALLLAEGRVQFRWLNDDIRECFFPSVTVFKQASAGDWSQPLKLAGDFLREIISQTKAPD